MRKPIETNLGDLRWQYLWHEPHRGDDETVIGIDGNIHVSPLLLPGDLPWLSSNVKKKGIYFST
jgi:hypothetical protein